MNETLEMSRPIVHEAQLARVLALVETTLSRWDWKRSPYFTTLRDGTFTREDFVETQVQFFWAVTFFSRPMALLVAKLPRTGQRIEVLRNVWEEHGEGNSRLSHTATFVEFLDRLGGLSETEIEARALWPEVRAFNSALVGACLLDEWLVGAATLGMIERMFGEISGEIGECVVSRGWLSTDRIIHYDVHRSLDVRHANDFFATTAGGLRSSADDYYVEQGLMQGAALFLQLYGSLFEHRQRRWMRTGRTPHLRA